MSWYRGSNRSTSAPARPPCKLSFMKLGLGLYRHMLTRENYQFARQAGATHIVAHLVDYFPQKGPALLDQPTGADEGWGRASDPSKLWTLAELTSLRKEV